MQPIRVSGYIARGVLGQYKSYGLRQPKNDTEKYELTQPECLTMTPRLVGKPIMTTHNRLLPMLEPVKLGEVKAARFDTKSGDWIVDLELSGPEAYIAMGGRDGNPIGLSLSHHAETLEVKEVSICSEPMREGCYLITNDQKYNAAGTQVEAAKPARMASDKMDTSKGDAPAAPQVPGTSSPPLPPQPTAKSGNDMDWESREGQLELMKRATANFTEPERAAFMKRQIENERIRKEEAVKEKQRQLEREEDKKRQLRMAQTWLETFRDVLSKSAKSSDDLQDFNQHVQNGQIPITAAYMPVIAAALGASSAPVKQPRKDPYWEQYMSLAFHDDTRELEGALANQGFQAPSTPQPIEAARSSLPQQQQTTENHNDYLAEYLKRFHEPCSQDVEDILPACKQRAPTQHVQPMPEALSRSGGNNKRRRLD